MFKSVLFAAAAGLAFSVFADEVKASAEYPEFYNGDSTKGIDFVQSIKVLAPRYCSNVKGDVTVVFEAKGMTRVLARCWRAGGEWGEDAVLADLPLGADARGEFVFHADEFPAGPTTIRLQAIDGKGHQDYCELQLFNLGGVSWKQGIPKSDPPGAKGMKLVFKDDFDGPLSISPDGRGARYAAHKTGGGDFSGWPFSDPDGDCLPFGQQGTYLRIHASKPYGTNGRTGILSSIRSDGTGVAVPVPAYFECRLMCHSAPGSWGAFWTLTKGTIGMSKDDPKFEATKNAGCDELDVIECYGGYGPRNPNHGGRYGVTTHWWGQKDMGEAPHAFPDAQKMAGGSTWSWTFHTYGLAITETDTVYYFDDVEVLRHPTGPVTKSQDTWFLINYAIAGISGWPYDVERYGNESDMWVDWVRVYCGKELPKDFGEIPVTGVKGTIGVSFTSGKKDDSVLRGWDIAGDNARAQSNWNNVRVSGGAKEGQLRDTSGAATSAWVALGKGAEYEQCEGWGFGGADFRLHRGALRNAPFAVSAVPFEKYDLVVHLGAGVNGWKGDVVLLNRSGEEIAARAVNFGWIGDGRYVEATREKGTDSDKADCMVVFRGLTEREFAVRAIHRDGKGAASITGFQLVPAK
jgi:hypothetical protein